MVHFPEASCHIRQRARSVSLLRFTHSVCRRAAGGLSPGLFHDLPADDTVTEVLLDADRFTFFFFDLQ